MDDRTECISLLVSTEEKHFLVGIANKVHLSLTDFLLLSALSTNGRGLADKLPQVESSDSCDNNNPIVDQ